MKSLRSAIEVNRYEKEEEKEKVSKNYMGEA